MSFRFSAACHISQNLSFYGRFLDMGPRSMVGHFTLLHRIIWSKNFDLFTMVYVLNRQCKYRTIALKLPNTMVHATMLQYYGFSIDILGISQLFCTKLAPFAPQKIQKKTWERYLIQGRTHQGIHLLAKSKVWRHGSEGVTELTLYDG